MFSFFKKKEFLVDIIPDNHIDIHSHILPGIDDGAPDITTSETLISEMNKIGFSSFICTPHIMPDIWNNNVNTITEAANLLLTSSEKSVQKSRIHYAAEYMMDNTFSNNLQEKNLLCLKENYVLVEMSYSNPPIQLFDIIFKLQCAGYIPILAHPERYNFYHNDFQMYKKLKDAGCLFQLNLLSTVNYYGSSVAKCADKLLKSGQIDFCGSDVHHINHVKSFYLDVRIKEIMGLKEAINNTKFFQD